MYDYQMRPQDLAVQNGRVEGRAWTWAVQGPSGGCAVAVYMHGQIVEYCSVIGACTALLHGTSAGSSVVVKQVNS